MLSGHKNNWQGHFGFVFLHGRRKEELVTFLIRDKDRSDSLQWHTQIVLVLISLVFFIFQDITTSDMHLLAEGKKSFV